MTPNHQLTPASRRRRVLAVALTLVMALSACSDGLRTTLVDPGSGATPQPPLELDLPPAPDSVPPVAADPLDAQLQSTVDDALLAWALDRQLSYIDTCASVTPGPGEYCDSPTERDTVRLLGPSADEVWYVVTFAEVTSAESGTGYRVSSVDIAGR